MSHAILDHKNINVVNLPYHFGTQNFLLKNSFPKNKKKNFITHARGNERVFKNMY